MNTPQRRINAEMSRTDDPLLRQQLKEEFKAWAPYTDDMPMYLSPLFELQQIRVKYAKLRGEPYRFYLYAPGIPDKDGYLPQV